MYFMGKDLEPFVLNGSGKCTLISDLPDMLRHTTAARAATLIMTFHNRMTFRELIETVHALRVTLGNRIRIIVRESGLFLRYYNELLLLKIGANLIIHDNVALARIPLLLESIRGQLYQTDTKFDFNEAIESILPSRKKGYLPPQRFCDEIDTVLIQAHALSVPCVLVVLRHPVGVDLMTSINRFRISRNGDLVTADASYCYVFLHACPEANFRNALTRLTGGNADDATEGRDFFSKLHAISGKIDQLRQLIKQQNMPDLSEQFALLPSVAPYEPAIAPAPPQPAIASAPIQPLPQIAPVMVTSPIPATLQRVASIIPTNPEPIVVPEPAVPPSQASAPIHAPAPLQEQAPIPIPVPIPVPAPVPVPVPAPVTQQTPTTTPDKVSTLIPEPVAIPTFYQAPAPRAQRKQR